MRLEFLAGLAVDPVWSEVLVRGPAVAVGLETEVDGYRSIDAMNQELQRIWLELKSTIVLVTHSIPESVFLADRAVSLAARPGRIAGITDIPFGRPRTPQLEIGAQFQGYVGRLRGLLDSRPNP